MVRQDRMDRLIETLTGFVKEYLLLNPGESDIKSRCNENWDGADYIAQPNSYRIPAIRCNKQCDLMVLGGLTRITTKMGLKVMLPDEKETTTTRYDKIYNRWSISGMVEEVKKYQIPSLHSLQERYISHRSSQPGCAVQDKLHLAIESIVRSESGFPYDSARSMFSVEPPP